MAISKRAARRAKIPRRTTEESSFEVPTVSVSETAPRRPGRGRMILVGLLVVLLVLYLAYRNIGLFVAAQVNGWPITRFDLNGKLTARYGSNVLDDLIDEQIIRQEAGAKGIKVTDGEINAKVEEIKKQLGEGVNIEDFLKERGYTLSDFRKQIEVQLLVEKITAGAVNVSDQEVTEFIEQNRANMTATEEAGLKAEALNFLTNRKKNEAVQKWFTDLKAKAKVTKYL